MKIRIAAAALLGLSTPAMAQETDPPKPITVSGSVAVVSDYRLRGVSQTDKHAAIQGGITVTHESGLYASAWGSNLSGWGTFGGSNMELDLIGGYKLPIGHGAALDVGLTWYMYPGGASKTDYAEPYVKLSGTVGPVSALAGVAYAPPQQALGNWYATPQSKVGDKEDNVYIWGDVSTAVPKTPVTLKV